MLLSSSATKQHCVTNIFCSYLKGNIALLYKGTFFFRIERCFKIVIDKNTYDSKLKRNEKIHHDVTVGRLPLRQIQVQYP